MSRRLRGERGAVLVIVAVAIPILLLFAALVVDIGNWKEKDRNLQTRADAAALAAGVEYVKQLKACIGSDPTAKAAAVTAIKGAAKTYAGDTGSTAPKNQGVNEQSRVWVGVNASAYSGADDLDGAATVCDNHTPDAISPGGGLWTDVKMTESDISSFFGSLGFPLSQVNARARVEMKQIIGIRERSLPFVAETGDQVECVWAEFVGAVSGDRNDGFTVTPSNPVPLTNGPYTWTASNVTLTLTNAQAKDIAVRYWLGAKNGSAPCDFNASPRLRGPVPQDFDGDNNGDLLPISIDWINVFDDGANPTANSAPKLRRFALTSNSCGGPGFLYTPSTLVSAQCRVNFIADVDTGVNDVAGSITVEVANDPDDDAATAKPASVDVAFPSGTGVRTVSGTITINPNTVSGSTTTTEDYTQVGQIFLRVKYDQTSGRIGGSDCSPGSPCTGTFPGETATDQWVL